MQNRINHSEQVFYCNGIWDGDSLLFFINERIRTEAENGIN